jgi:uncharacterized protein
MPPRACPTCRRAIPELPPEEPLPAWFPFCCQRCRMIDLGRWADGDYLVEGAPVINGDGYEQDQP